MTHKYGSMFSRQFEKINGYKKAGKDLKLCDGRVTEKPSTKEEIIDWLKRGETKCLK